MLPAGSVLLGTVAPTKSISGEVALVPRDPSLLATYATQVSTPRSAVYHRYLSLDEFRAAFSPRKPTILALERDLRSGGLKVTSLSSDRLLISFSGTASAVDTTFHTTIDSYRAAGGKDVFANDTAVKLPSNVASYVQAVVGLNDLTGPQPISPVRANRKLTHGKVPAPRVTPPAGAADPCAAASAQAASLSSLTANNVAYSYGLDPLYKAGDFGKGQTVDILDLFGYSTKDILTFDKCYYGATNGPKVAANDVVVPVDNGAQGGNGTGGSVETTLDTETVNAYAPQAKVDLYLAPDTNWGFLDAIAGMASSSATVESISYGGCELAEQEEEPGYLQIENYLFEQGAAMGKTVFASSGDSGNADLCASDPASQPFVTGVGGTAITAATNPPAEDVWDDGSDGGAGGGGISAIWPAPAWQVASTVGGFDNSSVVSLAETLDGYDFCQTPFGATAYTQPCREVPDISMQASPNTGGAPTFTDGAWAIWGGTSLASPMAAATLADINSTSLCKAAGGAGFISPKLYAIASNPKEYAASFTNVTIGNNDNLGDTDGLFPATRGYSMAAGLGSFQVTAPGGGDGLAYYLCSASSPAAPTVTHLSTGALSSAAVSGGTADFTITGTGFETAGKSRVADVSIGEVPLPSSDFSVTSATTIDVSSVPTSLMGLLAGNGGTGDGTGAYTVTVTVSGGATSAPNPNSRLIFYDPGKGSTGVTPVVDGTFPAAGVEAGGNAVTIYGSGFESTSGAPAVASVTFGGAPATNVVVVNNGEITADTPAEPSSSNCVSGDDPTTGACQVAVQVVLTDGTKSAVPAIPLEYSGDYPPDVSAGTYPAPDEFDYAVAPSISNISFLSSPDIADVEGGTVVTMTGTGLDYLPLEWINVGSDANSSNEDYDLLSIDNTSITFILTSPGTCSAPTNFPVTVQSYGSPNSAPGVPFGSVAPSNTVEVPFAPTPSIKALSVSGSHLVAGPTSGGSKLTIKGAGFDYSDLVFLEDLKYGFFSTQYFFDVVSNNEITLTTPGALTGVYKVVVCGISGCSQLSPQTFTYYLPGNPSLASSTPAVGRKGTRVTIYGDNLGFVRAVYFGKVKAALFSNANLWESGNTYRLTAVAPKGKAGSKVDIQVETVESEATGYGKSKVSHRVTFTYKK